MRKVKATRLGRYGPKAGNPTPANPRRSNRSAGHTFDSVTTEGKAEASIADVQSGFDADPARALMAMARAAGPDRLGLALIVHGVVEYLVRDPRLRQAPELLTIRTRLVGLRTALLDAEEGKATDLLAVKRRGGRQGSTKFELVIRGCAAGILDLLVQSGLDARTAASRIARRLQKFDVKPRGGTRKESGRGGAISAETVLEWHARIDFQHGTGVDEQIARDICNVLGPRSDMESEDRRGYLLGQLEAGIRERAAMEGKKELTPG